MEIVCVCIDEEKPGGVCVNPATRMVQVQDQQIPMCDMHCPEGATYSELNQETLKWQS